MFRNSKRHKFHNIEHYDPLAPQSRVHTAYGPRGARHQMIVVDFADDLDQTNATLTNSADWSKARFDAPAFVEADVELEEMEDCELEALGLSKYIQRETVPDKIENRMTQSVRFFFCNQQDTDRLPEIEASPPFLDAIYRHLY